MNPEYIYHYRKSRKQQSKIFRNTGVACWVYIAGLYVYEAYGSKEVSDEFRLIYIGVFAVASIIILVGM
ncbi:hypothetical protein [Sessilibacter sp. MAH4]